LTPTARLSIMSDIALLFIGFSVLVMVLLLFGSIYYVPKALQSGHEDDDEDDHGSGGQTV
jgi:hypothetical protein